METTMDMFKLPADRFVVIYHGVNPNFRPVPREEARQRLSEALGVRVPYILYVGNVQRRKNLVRLLEAFHIFRQETRLDIKLALSGGRDYDTGFVGEAIERHQLKEHVLELGPVPDIHMPDLYSAAEMLAFPTLWEGFGFPVVEAMACGTPVLTSNVSSLPEVAGEAALLVDPHNVEEISAGMCRIMTDSALRARLSEKGIERARTFTWARCQCQTLQALKGLVGL